MSVILTIYENGEPVDLPESSEAEVELRAVTRSSEEKLLDAIYKILGASFDSGESDVAARHDGHQP